MFSEDISRYIDVMIRSIEKDPNTGLDSVYIQHPDDLPVPSKNDVSESFVYLTIHPIEPVKDIASLNSYVDGILAGDFRPDFTRLAQETKLKSHILSLGFSRDDNVELPLLSLSKEYLLDVSDNAGIREVYGPKNLQVKTFDSDKHTFLHRINYDIIIFPDSDSVSDFVPKSHRFGEPYITPISIFRSSD